MNILTRILSTAIEEGYRIAKVLRMGKDDVQTADVAAPYGVDANPIKGMTAVFSDTAGEEKVIIGYINENAMAAPGEHRIYSTDDDGNVKIYIWLKKDGSMLLGGDADNAVRYKPLADAIKGIQDFLNQQLPLIASGISGGGGSYSPGTASFDVSGARINEIKTP